MSNFGIYIVRSVLVFSALGGATFPLKAAAYPRQQSHFDGEFYNSHSTLDFFLGAVKTGSSPKGLKISPDGSTVWVANMSSQFVTTIDLPKTLSLKPENSFSYFASDETTANKILNWLGTFPEDRLRSRNPEVRLFNKRDFVTNITTPEGHKKTGVNNIEVAFSGDGAFAYVSQMETTQYKNLGRLLIFETATKKLVAEVPTNGAGSKIVAVSPRPDNQGRTVAYISNWFDKSLSLVDVSKASVQHYGSSDHQLKDSSPELFIKKINIKSPYENWIQGKKFGVAPRGIAFSNDGKWALVANFDSRSVLVIDARNHRTLAELPPLPDNVTGSSSMRHVVMGPEGRWAYLSLLGKNAVIKIDFQKLISIVQHMGDGEVFYPEPGIWNEILQLWGSGLKRLKMNNISPEQPQAFKDFGGLVSQAHTNTIVLDPVQPRFLYVSNRMTQLPLGEIEVVDLETGFIIFTLIAGPHTTALDVSPDGCTLISSDFKSNHMVRLYDVCKLKQKYLNSIEGSLY